MQNVRHRTCVAAGAAAGKGLDRAARTQGNRVKKESRSFLKKRTKKLLQVWAERIQKNPIALGRIGADLASPHPLDI
jgi:hypothetical protein